jgi:hypothetical protein
VLSEREARWEGALSITSGRSCTINFNEGNSRASAMETCPVEPPTLTTISGMHMRNHKAGTYIDDCGLTKASPVKAGNGVLEVVFLQRRNGFHETLEKRLPLGKLRQVVEEWKLSIIRKVVRRVYPTQAPRPFRLSSNHRRRCWHRDVADPGGPCPVGLAVADIEGGSGVRDLLRGGLFEESRGYRHTNDALRMGDSDVGFAS